MKLINKKSKWYVVGDDGFIFNEYKTRGRAEKGLRLWKLYCKWGNGLTEKELEEVKKLQKELGEK